MLKKSLSSDSWEFPWGTKEKRRPTVVPQSQSGRNVTCTSFLMCFVSVLLLSCGMILLGVSMWSLMRKIPYSYLVDIKVDIPYFSIPAACICFPCFWISMSIHNNKKKYEFLHLLILLLVISIALLVTGASLGFIYLSRISANTSTTTIMTSLSPHDLNTTLKITILESDTNDRYRAGWDRLQTQLACCGVTGYKDWPIMNRSIPNSCYRNPRCVITNVNLRGCLIPLSRDLIWHLNVLKSQCYMISIIQVMAIMLGATVYFIQKRK